MIRVTQVGSEEELEQFNVWNVVFSFLKEKLNDTSIDVDLYSNKTCLKVELLEAGTTYCVVLFRRTCPRGRGSRVGGGSGCTGTPEGERGHGQASSWSEGQQGRSFLGKENGPAEGSVSSSVGCEVGEFGALVGGSPGALPFPRSSLQLDPQRTVPGFLSTWTRSLSRL